MYMYRFTYYIGKYSAHALYNVCDKILYVHSWLSECVVHVYAVCMFLFVVCMCER